MLSLGQRAALDHLALILAGQGPTARFVVLVVDQGGGAVTRVGDLADFRLLPLELRQAIEAAVRASEQ